MDEFLLSAVVFGVLLVLFVLIIFLPQKKKRITKEMKDEILHLASWFNLVSNVTVKRRPNGMCTVLYDKSMWGAITGIRVPKISTETNFFLLELIEEQLLSDCHRNKYFPYLFALYDCAARAAWLSDVAEKYGGK